MMEKKSKAPYVRPAMVVHPLKTTTHLLAASREGLPAQFIPPQMQP